MGAKLYKAGDTYRGEFTTRALNGTATAADSTPSATWTRNGADDGAVSVTIAAISGNRYAMTATIPSGYSAGDEIALAVSATVGGVTDTEVVDSFRLVGQSAGDLTVTMTDTLAQKFLRMLFGVSGSVYVVATTGNDANTGLSLDNAFATVAHAASTAASGDMVLVCPGTFSETLQVAPAANVQIVGCGPNVTTVNDTSVSGLQPFFKLNNNVRFAHMTINCSLTPGVTAFPIGVSFSNATNFLVEDIVTNGFSDSFYFWATGPTNGIVRDCIGYANEDTFNVPGMNGTVNVDLINCKFFLTIPASQAAAARALSNYSKGTIRAVNCRFSVRALATSTGSPIGVQNNNAGSANGGLGVELINTDIVIESYGSGTPYSIQSNTSEVRAVNSTFNKSQFSTTNGGIVTILGKQTDWVDSPNSTGMAAVAGAFWDVLTSATRVAGSLGAWLVGLVNGTGTVRAKDSSGDDLATATTQAAIQTSVNNLNNLSALANLFGPQQLEVPASGSIAYPFTLTAKDSEGHLIDLTGTPTITAANAAGTDRSANLSAVAHPSTGVYTFTYTVQSTAAQEGLTIKASGTAAGDSTSRLAYLSASVVAVDTTTAIAAIKAKTDLIGTNPADSPNAQTAQATLAKFGFDGSNNVKSTPQTPVTVTGSVSTTYPLKKNTLYNNFTFSMVRSFDGNPAAGLAVTGQVSLDGAAFVNLTNAVSEIGNGVYKVNLAAADLNGTSIVLKFTAPLAKQTVVSIPLET